MEDLSFIALKPSRIARNLHVVLALLALLALCLSGVGSIWKVLLALLLLWAALWQWRRDQSVPVKGLSCKSGRWCFLINDREYQGELCGEQRVLSWWVMLQWREDTMQKKTMQKKKVLALWPDSADPEDLRRLRVFLRYGQANAPAT